MNNTVCITCGWVTGDIEQHHVAGRRNYPTFTVPVCADCHLILTKWQRAHGVGLREDVPVTEVDRVRALAVGVFDLFRLLGQRHPQQVLLSRSLTQLSGRAMSRLFDQFAPADRPGRWMPDPTQPPVEVMPVAFQPETEADLVVLFARLTLQFADLFGRPEGLPYAAFERLVEQPDLAVRAWQELTADQARSAELVEELQDQLQRGMRVVGWMLTVGPDALPDPEMLEEVRLWFDGGLRVVDHALMLTGSEMRTTA